MTSEHLDPWDSNNSPSEQKQEIVNPEEKQLKEALSRQLDPSEPVDDDPAPIMESVPEHKEYGLQGQFYLSQSLIKNMVDRFGMEAEYCPKNIFHIYIAKDVKRPRTEAMMEGSYGENIILGRGAKNDGDHVSLPKNAVSKKPKISQQRIEIQAERFKTLSSIYQISVIPGINVQVPVFKKHGNVILRGILDIFPTPILWEGELSLAIIDIKFTADVHSTFGAYSWGDVDSIDYIQGDMYHHLVRDFDLELNIKHGYEFQQSVGYENLFTDFVKRSIAENKIKFIYMVFGYKKPDLNNQFLMLNRNYQDPKGGNLRNAEFVNRVKKTIAMLNMEHKRGWPAMPYKSICKTCPMNIANGGDCTEPTKLNNV